jgi:hypothetical protein
LRDVLRDKEAYILLYARDDSGGKSNVPEETDVLVNGNLQSPASVNGNRLSAFSSDKKRPFNLNESSEKPFKKRRLSSLSLLSESEDEVIGPMRIERAPLERVNSSISHLKPRTYSRVQVTSSSTETSVVSNGSHRPYTEKSIPPPFNNPKRSDDLRVKRGSETSFMQKVHQNPYESKRLQSPKKRKSAGFGLISPERELSSTVSKSKSSTQSDEFANGFHESLKRHPLQNRKRSFYSGINTTFIGETTSFSRDAAAAPRRLSVGIKVVPSA